MKMEGSVLEEKSSFNILWLSFCSKLDWGFYIVSDAKTASKKIAALIRSTKFLSPEVSLYLNESTIKPWWNTFVMSWLEFLTATWIFWINCRDWYTRLLVLTLLFFLNPRLIVEMLLDKLFSLGIDLIDLYLNWCNRFHFLILAAGPFVFLIDSIIVLSPFLDVIRISTSAVFFFAQLDSESFYRENSFLWPLIWIILVLKKTFQF